MNESIRVILLDDHPLVLEGIHNRLQLEPDIEVVASYTDPLLLLEDIPQLQADVIVIDASMPHMTGFELSTKLKELESFSMKIVMLSGYMYNVLIQKAYQIGINAYISKQSPYEEILYTIRQVALGCNLLSPSRPTSPLKQEQLSAIEREVLRRIAEEKNNRQVAYELAISMRTVEHHIISINQKLGVKSRGSAVAKGYELGLLGPVS
ncbi:response regulator transcription factor [Paenibacillus sp. SC116]|uniref:response regulator transcription factor n=1 Tax=Paenibacillus sp. SC116 TaxID=2968986 RepID=UPI00215B2BB8|nr:response regulator transcription factor [Paenibacillus sp. SC116]MCR8844111.1 response regulator transcription factor [Paenibacillus sp. SC116]